MRLFAAIELDEAARAAIAEEQQRLVELLRAHRATVPRLVSAEHMHLTLVFIGEVPEARAPAIVRAAAAPIALPPFGVGFGGIGAFPPRGAPRVLWLGLADGAPAIVELQETIASRLEQAGVAREPRPFQPHLTLGRWKESRASDRPRADETTPAMVARVEVDSVALIQSRLSSRGPTYAVLARAALGGVH
ncbi:MAG TPA: RNA 2',3'-cyclic phosphodiesterase [Vicinamibacterales bacterium]|jgi:2'-5' RNA ligase